MIEIQHLSKRYGTKLAVDDITAAIRPGIVTGFLGPNGAGKSTTMRMMVGLDRPTSGSVTIGGHQYRDSKAPLHEVGALLEAKAVHTGRTAQNHLLALAATHGISKKRVGEVIEMTGLGSVAKKRVGGFSLGMGQRLGIAAALLGDPHTLILDEPVNGLDPEGVLWVRRLTRQLADEGRTVFLSSHLMSEMAQTADHVIVLGRGKIIADAPMTDIIAASTGNLVHVRTPQPADLARVVAGPDVTVTSRENGLLEVTGLDARQIGESAASHGLVLHELTPVNASLEDAYLQLTNDAVEYRTEEVR
ncbi:ABC transporter ATP-binding protein [Paramicrobacterium agarici]|uniref:ABC-2 type transport system ATP-binding protein n=1 Tax=Paramicrobacterium agarici TaxID=630514 RepID=A0A2A9DX12_9MICO|nr:ATP-binding cassette domain-containing protein [Microbacterium agarici]PFG30542.1 ABC-2 type transport system ATP-binding protein [Microbacterium agarici]